jgi:predicted esterase YcpF (UPF0227 family)
MARATYTENDARHQTSKVNDMLDDVAQRARQDIAKVSDPRAQALLETTAEVVLGLRKAYDDFEEGTEAVWK